MILLKKIYTFSINKIKFYFKKLNPIRIYGDIYEITINYIVNIKKFNKNYLKGFSFIIITDGNNNKGLKLFLNSIYNEFKDNNNYEIIIIGPNKKTKYISNINYKVKLINYYDTGFNIPGFITNKKNIGAKIAKYDKLVISHDYMILTKGWKKGMINFGDNFIICMNIILNKDKTRFFDWILLDYPGLGFGGLLPYNVNNCNEFQFIGGSFFITKKDFFIKNPLSLSLRWGEGEDIEWSKRIRKKTIFKMNQNSTIILSKLKDKNQAPYSKDWRENTKKIIEITRK